MAQTDNPNPKMQLPETWAEKMACPVCGSRPLGVFHPSNHADRFACGSCETSFELEEAGKRVRFVTLPQGVTPWMRSQWVLIEEALASFELARNEQVNLKMGDGTGELPPEPAPAQPAPAQPAQPAPAAQTPAIPPAAPSPAPQPAPEQKPVVIEEPVALNSIKSQPPVVEEKPVPRKRELHDPFPELSIAPEELTTGPYLLYASDRKEKKASGTSPFYDDDFSEEVAVPAPAPEPEDDHEAWKDGELARVNEALVNPPSNGFVGKLTPPEPWEPSKAEKDLANNLPAKASEPVKTIPVQYAPENPPEAAPVQEEKPAAVDYSSAEYESPARPVEETPPASYLPAEPKPPVIAESTHGDDLDDIRTHITSTTAATTVNSQLEERMTDAMERARELQRLGNTPAEVRSILQRSSGLTPEQVAEVLKRLEKPEEKRRTNRILLIFMVVALVIFALLALFFTNLMKSITNGTSPAGTPAAFSLAGKLVDPGSLPAPLQTMMPNGIQILNEDPVVETSDEATIPAASCPASQTDAAALFGGPASDWNRDSNTGGWMLLTQTQGVVIRVPANMTGGYLVMDKGPEMRGVTGPAVVKNIYMLSISCQ